MELTGENKLGDNTTRMYEDKIKLGNKIYIQDAFRTVGYAFKMALLCWFFTAVYFCLIQEIARKEHEEIGIDHDHVHCGGDHMIEYIYGSFEAQNTCIAKLNM